MRGTRGRAAGSATVELLVVVPFVLALLAAVWDLRQFIAYRADLAREMYALAEVVSNEPQGGAPLEAAIAAAEQRFGPPRSTAGVIHAIVMVRGQERADGTACADGAWCPPLVQVAWPGSATNPAGTWPDGADNPCAPVGGSAFPAPGTHFAAGQRVLPRRGRAGNAGRRGAGGGELGEPQHRAPGMVGWSSKRASNRPRGSSWGVWGGSPRLCSARRSCGADARRGRRSTPLPPASGAWFRRRRPRRTRTPRTAGGPPPGERTTAGQSAMNAIRRFSKSLRRTVAGFVRSQHGGGMLVGGVFVLLMMAIVGERMTNYAWQEAQFEELQSGLRAAVASAGPLLGDLDAPNSAGAVSGIQSRVSDFVTALLSGVNVEAADVGVAHDRSTGVTTVTVAGERIVGGIWGVGDDVTEFESDVRVRYRRDRFEVATALDVSRSMLCDFGGHCPARNGHESRLDALKSAMDAVADTMAATAATRSGTLMVSMVPFSGAVNVADTGGTGHTAAKERYVRMLVGPHDSTAEMLRTARGLRDTGAGGHWVDTFHHYGASENPGVLARQYLPDSVLEDRDWDLRQTGVTLDVSAQVPRLDDWEVDDTDFWNGCVMARWGAYWDAAAREPGWTANRRGNWPARQEVPRWSPGADPLPETTPLHLSDAPPDKDRPHTLFTAYSWPDARIGDGTDARLQTVMARVLGAPDSTQVAFWRDRVYDHMVRVGQPVPRNQFRTLVDDGRPLDPLDVLATLDWPNDWSGADGGGDAMCPPSPVLPLTEDVAAMRTAAAGLSTVDLGPGRDPGATLLPLGLAWGLRTLSPLWRDVWQVADGRGAARPGVSCAPGEEQDCDASLTKAIVLVTDGQNLPGTYWRGQPPLRVVGLARPLFGLRGAGYGTLLPGGGGDPFRRVQRRVRRRGGLGRAFHRGRAFQLGRRAAGLRRSGAQLRRSGARPVRASRRPGGPAADGGPDAVAGVPGPRCGGGGLPRGSRQRHGPGRAPRPDRAALLPLVRPVHRLRTSRRQRVRWGGFGDGGPAGPGRGAVLRARPRDSRGVAQWFRH